MVLLKATLIWPADVVRPTEAFESLDNQALMSICSYYGPPGATSSGARWMLCRASEPPTHQV
jgi:hypothetical protein